jgi:hypothetical protein
MSGYITIDSGSYITIDSGSIGKWTISDQGF